MKNEKIITECKDVAQLAKKAEEAMQSIVTDLEIEVAKRYGNKYDIVTFQPYGENTVHIGINIKDGVQVIEPVETDDEISISQSISFVIDEIPFAQN